LNRRDFLASAAAAIVSPLSAAVVTNKFTLANTAWTDLGPGPMLLSFRGQGVYAIGDVAPALLGGGFTRARGGSIPVNTTSHVWAMSASAANVDVYVAPIVPKGGGGGATGHRYWRISIPSVQSSGYAALAEVQFRTTAGVPLLFSGGTAIASSEDTVDGSYQASQAADNNPATFWASLNPVPQWWEYDYGAGNAKAIVEITILPRAGTAGQGPAIFTPQWSDDGSNWTSMADLTPATWVTGQIQTFAVTPVSTTSVWSASDASANGMTLTNGGLTVSVPTGGASWGIIRNTISQTSGKLYIEFSTSTGLGSESNFHIGLASSGVNINSYLGDSNYSFGASVAFGNVFVSSGFTSLGTIGTVPVNAGDTFALAVDFTASMAWIARENIWVNNGNPAAEFSPVVTFVPATVGPLFFAMAHGSLLAKAPVIWTLQPTAASQKYAPPSGFTPWG
jgi:hypothetical protein